MKTKVHEQVGNQMHSVPRQKAKVSKSAPSLMDKLLKVNGLKSCAPGNEKFTQYICFSVPSLPGLSLEGQDGVLQNIIMNCSVNEFHWEQGTIIAGNVA